MCISLIRTEKESASPPPSVPGLETTLPLLMNTVQAARLTVDQVVAVGSTNPRRLFNLPEQPESYVEVELGGLCTLPKRGWQIRPDWSPFAGEVVRKMWQAANRHHEESHFVLKTGSF